MVKSKKIKKPRNYIKKNNIEANSLNPKYIFIGLGLLIAVVLFYSGNLESVLNYIIGGIILLYAVIFIFTNISDVIKMVLIVLGICFVLMALLGYV